VLQLQPESKRRGGTAFTACREHAFVYSRDASSAFHPRQARQRYCSEGCRKEARKWSCWKAQRRYRETTVGKEKRNGQSPRYRERVRTGKPEEKEAVEEAARVITPEEFFRALLRPARLLRNLPACGEVLYNASVRTHAGARWNEFASGNGTGKKRAT